MKNFFANLYAGFRAWRDEHPGVVQGAILLVFLSMGALTAAASKLLPAGPPREELTSGGALIQRTLTREQPGFVEELDGTTFSDTVVLLKTDSSNVGATAITLYASGEEGVPPAIRRFSISPGGLQRWQRPIAFSRLRVELDPESGDAAQPMKVDVILYLPPARKEPPSAGPPPPTGAATPEE